MAILFDKTMPEPSPSKQDQTVRRNGNLHLHPKAAGRQAAETAMKQAFAILGTPSPLNDQSKK